MAWMMLVVAGVLEVVWAYAMKASQGFTKLGASCVMVVAMLASIGLLARAMRTIPLGTAYPIWTGIGAVGAFVVGTAVLGERASAARTVAALLIIGGVVLMKLATPAAEP